MYYERLQLLFFILRVVIHSESVIDFRALIIEGGTDYNIDKRAYRRLLFDTNNRVWIDRSA